MLNNCTRVNETKEILSEKPTIMSENIPEDGFFKITDLSPAKNRKSEHHKEVKTYTVVSRHFLEKMREKISRLLFAAIIPLKIFCV